MSSKIVLVEWRDSCYAEQMQFDEDIQKVSHIQTTGFLIKERKHSISVARERSSNGYRGVITIPRENIKRLRELHVE